MQGVWVWSLVGELRSHISCTTKKKNKSWNKGWGEDAAAHEVSSVKDASQTAPLTASDDLVLQGVTATFLKPIDIFCLWPWRCTLTSKCITASSPTTSTVMVGGSQAQLWLQGQQECHLLTSPTISGCSRTVSFLFFIFRHLQMHGLWLCPDRSEFVTLWAIMVRQEWRAHRTFWNEVPKKNSARTATTAGLGSPSSIAEPMLEVPTPRKLFEILLKRGLPTQGE